MPHTEDARQPCPLYTLVGISVFITIVGYLAGFFIVYSQPQPHLASVRLVWPSNSPAFFEILLRNMSVAIFLAAGRVTLGTTSLAGLLAVGFAVGKAIALALQRGIPPASILAALLPHGVVELSGLWIAAAVGLSGALSLVRASVAGAERDSCWRSHAGVAAMLIVIAAITECTITPLVIGTLPSVQ